MFDPDLNISDVDPELRKAMRRRELAARKTTVELIASENYASPAVMEAQGSVLTNKYAEGYPGKRYYGGCEYVDVAEQLAIDRVKSAVRRRIRQRAAALRLAGQRGGLHGGAAAGRHHPGHVARARRPPDPRRLGQLQRQAVTSVVAYGVEPDTKRIDYDEGRALADEHKPKMIVAGASAYSRGHRLGTFPRDRRPRRRHLLVDMAHYAGLVAAGLYPEPGRHRRLRDHHHAQDAARPARRPHPVAGRSSRRPLNSTIFPGIQGGPLMHVIAAKAAGLQEAMRPTSSAIRSR